MYHTPMDSSGKYVYSRRSRGQIFCIEFQNDASREKNRFSPWYTRWWRSGWEGAGSIFFRFKHLFVFPESRYYSEFSDSYDRRFRIRVWNRYSRPRYPVFLYELPLVFKTRRKSETMDGPNFYSFLDIRKKENIKLIPFHWLFFAIFHAVVTLLQIQLNVSTFRG